MSVNIQIARAQLGTALDLFIRDKDPYSIHALACGDSEIVEGLAKEGKLPSISVGWLDLNGKFVIQITTAIEHFSGSPAQTLIFHNH